LCRYNEEQLMKELAGMMRELEGFQNPPQSVVAIAVALLLLLRPDDVIPLIGADMRWGSALWNQVDP
jgi:hypothetical protein